MNVVIGLVESTTEGMIGLRAFQPSGSNLVEVGATGIPSWWTWEESYDWFVKQGVTHVFDGDPANDWVYKMWTLPQWLEAQKVL